MSWLTMTAARYEASAVHHRMLASKAPRAPTMASAWMTADGPAGTPSR